MVTRRQEKEIAKSSVKFYKFSLPVFQKWNKENMFLDKLDIESSLLCQ